MDNKTALSDDKVIGWCESCCIEDVEIEWFSRHRIPGDPEPETEKRPLCAYCAETYIGKLTETHSQFRSDLAPLAELLAQLAHVLERRLKGG